MRAEGTDDRKGGDLSLKPEWEERPVVAYGAWSREHGVQRMRGCGRENRAHRGSEEAEFLRHGEIRLCGLAARSLPSTLNFS